MLMRKIDWHVVPWLAVLYLLNFLDRGNIGNARVRHEHPPREPRGIEAHRNVAV